MTASFKKIPSIFAAALALSLPAHAQVITSLGENGGGVVTTVEEGAVKETDYSAPGIFNEWSDILMDFTSYKDEKELYILPEEECGEKKEHVFLNGKELFLPTCIDENGVDLYLLTTEGIFIYLALSAPVYFQEPDSDVVKWIHYYAHRNRSRTARLFRRYEKWEKPIKEYFTAVGIPAELAELCIVESGCTYDALSPAGALGLWQIMPSTGRGFGLRINEQVDDRRDPVLSTQAAAKILLANYRRLGDWTLAAAAYNCGAGRIQSELRRGHQTWETMKGSLPKETSQYIPSLIAIHYVWTYRDKLNIR